jgi:methylenetetrahydrofolate reductase (NADPH)
MKASRSSFRSGGTSRLQQALEAGQFVATAEIVPPLAAEAAGLLREADLLGEYVDAINVTDGAGARTSISSFAAAAILAAHGHEPILQATCRDRNRIALAGDLIGAAAQGVRNLLCLRGDDPAAGDQPDAKAVFDLDSVALMRLASRMCDPGTLPSGRRIEPPPRFFIGGADTPRMPDARWDAASLLAKADAGARFIQTQFCFDLALARRYLGRLVDEGVTERLHFLIGIGPIASARSARWMSEHLYGVSIPEAVVARLEGARDPAREGVRICVELIEGVRELPGAAGVHLMAPGRGPEALVEVLATCRPGLSAQSRAR